LAKLLTGNDFQLFLKLTTPLAQREREKLLILEWERSILTELRLEQILVFETVYCYRCSCTAAVRQSDQW
jgi:hypothetical protein